MIQDTSNFLAFVQAFIMGIVISAPLGPVGVLCIRKTLDNGLRAALFVGAGAALTDTCYGVVAYLGVTQIVEFLRAHMIWIQGGGGLFLLYMGIGEWRSPTTLINAPTIMTSSITTSQWILLFIKSFFLTLINPLTILSFIGIFAILAHYSVADAGAGILGTGVFLGCMTWWSVLGTLTAYTKNSISAQFFTRLHHVSGVILMGMGGWALFMSLLAS